MEQMRLKDVIFQMQVEQSGKEGEKRSVTVQPDTPINFLQLSKLDSLMGTGDMLDMSLSAALGTGRVSTADFATSKLNKVFAKKLKSGLLLYPIFFYIIDRCTNCTWPKLT